MSSPLDTYAASKMGPMKIATCPQTVATRFKVVLPDGVKRALLRMISTSEFRYLQAGSGVTATTTTAGRVQANQDWPLLVEGPGDQFISIIHGVAGSVDVQINIVSSVDDWSLEAA